MNTLPYSCREAVLIAWKLLSAVSSPQAQTTYPQQWRFYGDRMGHIAEYHGINYDMLAFEETEQVSVDYVDDYLSNNSDITHVAVVHCETTTGILNPLKEIAHIVKLHNKS